MFVEGYVTRYTINFNFRVGVLIFDQRFPSVFSKFKQAILAQLGNGTMPPISACHLLTFYLFICFIDLWPGFGSWGLGNLEACSVLGYKSRYSS